VDDEVIADGKEVTRSLEMEIEAFVTLHIDVLMHINFDAL